MKSSEKSFGGDGYIHFLDCGDTFTVVFIQQNIKFYTSNICSLLYVIYIY